MQLAERLPASVAGSRWLRSAARYEPWVVLGPLLVAQWLALVAFVLTVRHNSWLFYQGGDQTFYYTTSWLLSERTMPTTPIGYAWPYLLTPIALFKGENVLGALPAVVLFQVIFLLPLALLCVYGIASRIGGRLLGYWAAALWVAAPYLVIPLWDQRYHQKWVEIFLPQGLGLTGLADYPSMVALLVAAYFFVRTLETRDWRHPAVAGLATAFAIGIKPANALFLAGPALGFLVARRWRQIVPFALAMAPALVTLAIWKQRGLGTTPALSLPAYELDGLAAIPIASILDPVTRYLDLDWNTLDLNRDALREFFASVRPLEYLPIAGAIAVARRSLALSAFLGGWFLSFLVLKGTNPAVRVEDASFFRLMMPGYPAYFLLAVSLPVLVPTLGPRLLERFPPAAPGRPIGRRVLVAAGVVFAVVPLIMVSTVRAQRGPIAVNYYEQSVFVPVSESLDLEATPLPGGRVRLSWTAPERQGVRVFYLVFRVPRVRPDLDPFNVPPVVEGLNCLPRKFAPGADDCRVTMDVIGTTTATTWVDRPDRGKPWTYRVGLSANWLADPTQGDVLMLSPPANVTLPRE